MPGTYDYVPRHSYQGDRDDDLEAYDPFMDEDTEEPPYGFGVPEQDLRYELDKLDELDVDESLLHQSEDDDIAWGDATSHPFDKAA